MYDTRRLPITSSWHSRCPPAACTLHAQSVWSDRSPQPAGIAACLWEKLPGAVAANMCSNRHGNRAACQGSGSSRCSAGAWRVRGRRAGPSGAPMACIAPVMRWKVTSTERLACDAGDEGAELGRVDGVAQPAHRRQLGGCTAGGTAGRGLQATRSGYVPGATRRLEVSHKARAHRPAQHELPACVPCAKRYGTSTRARTLLRIQLVQVGQLQWHQESQCGGSMVNAHQPSQARNRRGGRGCR